MRRIYIASAIVLGAGVASMAACSSDPGPLPQECPVYDNDGSTSGNNTTTGDTTTGTTGAGGNTSTTATTGAGAGGASTGSGGGAQLPSGAEIQSRLHGCRKLRYETFGTMLGDFGVQVDAIHNDLNLEEVIDQCLSASLPGQCSGLVRCQNDDSASGGFPSNLTQSMCSAQEFCFCPVTPCTNDPSNPGQNPGNAGFCVREEEVISDDVVEELHPDAAFLYQTARDAMSVPKIDSRTLEKDGHTTSSAMKIFDIFIQSAPEIIANIANPAMTPKCTVDGENPEMFDPSDGSCVEEAVSCLIGYPATDDHMLLCNLILDKADSADPIDVQKKQFIAVATLLSAAHTCE